MKADFEKVLKQWWGYDNFRGIQKDIIESIYAGHDTLGLMPTGGGKSVAFQVPALMKEGVCLVVTPLIALMKDQVTMLKRRGIKAAAVYTGMSRTEVITALENCIFGDYKFLYISPERLSSELFLAKLRDMKVSFITVDEAHCISQWGYDFRPSYLSVGNVRRLLPGVPVLALTATATPEVIVDIQKRLSFEKENVFRMSFERKNLAYVVRRVEAKTDELLHILKSLSGCAIVYCRNRKGTEEIADFLQDNGITATCYHAGLAGDVRDERQKDWQENKVRVMVATNAFGMGIDKPDVRCVIHLDMPDSPEAYFQEAGRGGRDGKKAFAVLLYNNKDKTTLKRRVAEAFPDKDFIRRIYEHLAYYYQLAMGDGQGVTREFDLEKFCRTFRHFPIPAESALTILTRAGYIEYTSEDDNKSRVMFLTTRDDLYRLESPDNDTERVIQSLLRAYSGLFQDFVYIEESRVARLAGIAGDRIYPILISLARQHVISYIPRKRVAYITYTRPRSDSEHLYFPESVYEKRKEAYIRRINAMIDYVEDEDKCRSRMLLDYFGERNEHNCEVCDVCLQRHASGLRKGLYENIRTSVLEWLNNGESSHLLTGLQVPGEKKEDMEVALRYMVAERQLVVKDGEVRLCH